MNPQNANRARVKQLVSLSPGIHLRRLQKLLDLSFSTTRYHVNNLVRDGEVTCATFGGYSRLYPAGTTDEVKTVYACLQNRGARAVLKALLDGPARELTQGELSEMVDLPRSTLSECTARLGGVRLVRRSLSTDGTVVFGVLDRETAATFLHAFDNRGFLNIASDKFIELWDI